MSHNTRPGRHSLCILFFLLTTGCRFGQTTLITVRLPDIPGDSSFPFPDGRPWILVSWDGRGGCGEKEISFSGGDQLSLEVLKESPVLCLLYPPRMAEHFQPRPAGGIFVPGEPGRLEMTWLGGAATEFFLKTAERGGDLHSLNLRRWFLEIQERGAPDPWALDWELLGRQLARREMRTWYIRKTHGYDLELPFPPGTWSSRSFWLPAVGSSGCGPVTVELSTGTHSFYNAATGEVFAVQVDDRGEFFCVLYPPGESSPSGEFRSFTERAVRADASRWRLFPAAAGSRCTVRRGGFPGIPGRRTGARDGGFR